MTSKVQIINYGPKPIRVVVQAREDGRFAEGHQTVIGAQSTEAFFVYDAQSLQILEVEPEAPTQ